MLLPSDTPYYLRPSIESIQTVGLSLRYVRDLGYSVFEAVEFATKHYGTEWFAQEIEDEVRRQIEK